MENTQLKHISSLPEPPYYAVIFTSQRTQTESGYAQAAELMLSLAAQQVGFLGVDSVRENLTGITVSYWTDMASIQNWKQQTDHLHAQSQGKSLWYEEYAVRIAKIDRSYSFSAAE